MNLFDISIIKHPELADNEAWIITDRDAPQVPKNIRSELPIPCILAGNTEQATRMLNLLRAITLYEDKSTSKQQLRVSAHG